MSIKSLSYTILKLLAVYIFVETFIPSLFSFITYLSPDDFGEYKTTLTIMWLSYAIGILIITLVVWFTANSFSEKISSGFDGEEYLTDTATLKEPKIIEIGLIVIGFFIIVTRFPLIVNQIMVIVDYLSSEGDLSHTKYVASLVQTSITLILALIFIIGREKLSSWILKLRTAGITNPD